MGARRTRGRKPRTPKGGSEDGRNSGTSYFATTSSPEFLDQTIAFWGPKYGRDLTREDARQIIENMTGFFKVLYAWDEEDRRAEAQRQAGAVSNLSDDDRRTED
ncbi:hypothetical protein ACVIHI_007976 [Bradyrhizobium sp. USDA 4524]|uniref:hypothetical protein n=1 Tax=unclassified Bradyrhizobium TaxID=2631580 RepID=UPI00209ECFCB|nr:MULTISPECIES: hypothetical protein [unclassified Bradyrhizobium]MCP1839110.1 hypothetical protein [Bradyrhizobium sp. USDA 4538]MCP1899675.1 hypothetical protein [Bradyrhizobium sp. USDA 4537]MCP1986215.1 hypothetical protein [Bradyrhizobium sp. USDA 4539]